MSNIERIPRTIDEFNSYIRIANNRQLATNSSTGNPFWKDYNWTSAQSTEFNSRHDKWVNDIFKRWSSAETSTSIVKKEWPKFIRSLIDYVKENKLVEKIKSCDIVSVEDATVWRFPLTRSKRSFRREMIQKEVFGMLLGSQGGRVKCKVRVTKSEGRAKIPRADGADSVQYAWAAVNKGDTAPSDIGSSFYKKDISTKAIFHFEAGAENITKYLVIYFRWYNTKHPNLAGVWTEEQRMVIG
jgi:hypothetical protein